MDDLKRLVEDTLRRTTEEGDGSAVMHRATAPNLYVQWLLFPDREGIHVEVSNPETQKSKGSIWQRLRGGEGDSAAVFGEEQLAALGRLGFTAGDPNYERDLTAEELDRGEAADILTGALREVLGIRDAADLTAEVL